MCLDSVWTRNRTGFFRFGAKNVKLLVRLDKNSCSDTVQTHLRYALLFSPDSFAAGLLKINLVRHAEAIVPRVRSRELAEAMKENESRDARLAAVHTIVHDLSPVR